MAESSRDARRRRILDRGTDRLALIAGQIRNLPSGSGSVSDLPPEDGHSRTASCPPSISLPQLPSSPSQTLDSPQTEEKGSVLSLPILDSVPETNQQYIGGDRAGPFIRKRDSSTEPSKLSSDDPDGKGSSIEDLSEIQNPRDSGSFKDQGHKPLAHLFNMFTFNEVKSAISASESTRSICSVVVAILVVLAHVGFPVLGSRLVKSVIFIRPLYFLLLTNITILIALLLEKQRGLQRPELQPTGIPSVGEHGLADQLGAYMELGLFLANVMGALFMDCSIYAITLVCGFSLARSLGW